ncbi:hypothetical protein Sango_2727700 [Sesamum angolense]|uniref:Aminotransferase-like plant mobile domain-containing protein n=1 Tax=Sesamum angolense TaxID=2727404 RepID=A0AAE1T5Z1_9LAMI|nr:hypothetical protein Sango_2727700 [Sesamum angolense]
MVSRDLLSKNIKSWTLRATHHEPPRHQPSDDFAHLCNLGHSNIEGDAKLRHLKIYDVVYASLFTYDYSSDIVKAFAKLGALLQILCLLLPENCSSRVDLHELVRLSMRGCLYDEVVPSALEVTGVDEKRERFIPRSSKYLLYAYHLLQSADDNRSSRTSIDKWSLKEDVYLVAYLACWLCVFVFPSKDVNSIRPSTFMMASLMANGRRVNLAIPVLGSIYEGLDTIATSPKPAGTSHSFPIHFVYAWLVCYFKTHYSIWQELRGPKMTRFSGEGGAKYYEPQEACKRIHKTEFVSWACNMLVKDGPFKFVDDGHAEELDHNYCRNLFELSYFLSRPKSIKITLKRKNNEDKQVDGGENNPPDALVPPVVIECDSPAVVSETRQKNELTLLKATGTNESASQSSLANFVAESIDVEEESETSHSSTMTPLLGMGLKRKQSPPPAAVLVFEGESFLFNYQKEFLQKLWSGLLVKISNTPVDFLSSIEDDVYLILKSMKSFQKFDVSKVEESLNMFFVKVRAYDEARSLSSEKLSRSLHEQQLKEAKARLQNIQAKASEKAFEVQSAMDELEHIEKEIVALKG